MLARRRELLDSVTSRARPGKATRATATPPSSSNSSSNPQAVPFRIPGVDTPRPPLRLPPLPLELAGTRPPQKWWLSAPNLRRLLRLHRRMTTCTFAYRGRRWRQWIPGSPRRCSTCFQERWAAKSRTSPSISSNAAAVTRIAAVLEIPAPFRTRVSRSCNLAGLAIRA